MHAHNASTFCTFCLFNCMYVVYVLACARVRVRARPPTVPPLRSHAALGSPVSGPPRDTKIPKQDNMYPQYPGPRVRK
jgi:hypothetical protein